MSPCGAEGAHLSETEHLTRMEKLLLMAAAVRGLRPGINLQYANTARVVQTTLDWAGLNSDEVQNWWKSGEWDPSLDEVYGPLVRMTQQQLQIGGFRPAERPGPALFEGSGNWGVPGDPKRPPADPRFNSCRLTETGDRLALLLLAEHPEYGPPGEPDVPFDYLKWGWCVVSDLVLGTGQVGYMYRLEPLNESDSGWRFMSGREFKEYIADRGNLSWEEVHVIAGGDQEIIPLLDAPIGSQFVRKKGSGPFVAVDEQKS